MPKRHEPKTLKDYSMIAVAVHFDLICYGCKTSSEMSDIVNDDSYLKIDGPFVSLPGTVLTDLMEAILDQPVNGFLHRKHIHHLLLPQVQSMRLVPSAANVSFGLEIMTKRCKNLRRLDLSYIIHVSPGVLITLLPNLSKLVYLNLKRTEVVDQMLRLIGFHCKLLRELNVSFCPITSKGLLKLCYDENEDVKMCQNLIHLNIIGCPVGPEAVCLLLQTIPTLCELNYENTFQIFNILATDSSFDFTKQPKVYHISHLTSTDGYIDEKGADLAVQLSPLVSNVTIFNTSISNETLYKTMVMENLSHLRFTNNDDLTIDFHEGILPILTVKGHQLQSLLLAKFTCVDIQAIGECCPRLKNLALSEICFYEELMYPRETYFNELNVLELWTDLGVESVTSVIIKQLLLFSSNIHNILFSGVRVLDDNLFLEILRINQMIELSRMTLENCPQVSPVTLEYLFDCPNALCLVRIWSCFFITKEINEILQKRIREENCDVYLEWFPWQG